MASGNADPGDGISVEKRLSANNLEASLENEVIWLLFGWVAAKPG